MKGERGGGRVATVYSPHEHVFVNDIYVDSLLVILHSWFVYMYLIISANVVPHPYFKINMTAAVADIGISERWMEEAVEL